MKYKVFILSNPKQMLGAYVSKYTIEKYTKNRDKFDVEIVNTHKIKELKGLYGKEILKDGKIQEYSSEDLQSFTLARFMPPEWMGYKGRAIVIDPDIFSTYSDIWDLLNRDMKGAAIMCRVHNKKDWGTSVMLLDCAKLKHWKLSEIAKQLKTQKVEYRDFLGLRKEKAKIGELEKEWNSFDVLTPDTKMLHNTLRITQPWRVGLPLDFTPKKMKPFYGIPREWIHYVLGRNPYRQRRHPDKNQTKFFFGHLKGAIEAGYIKESFIDKEIDKGYIRKDAKKVLARAKAI